MIRPQPAPGEGPERWNWDAPLLISPHQTDRIYYGSQRIWKSDDRGQSWQRISPGLDTDTPADWALTPSAEKSTPRRGPSPVRPFAAEWDFSSGSAVLKWPAVDGASSYLVRSSADLQSWNDEALIQTTSWALPSAPTGKRFYRVEAF